MREKRDEIIILRTTKAEKNRIYEKMLGMGIRSLSAYIRKMALDGYCLHLDLKELRRMAYLLQMCSNNLNQYSQSHHLQLHRTGQYPEIPGFFVIWACGAATERFDLSGASALRH